MQITAKATPHFEGTGSLYICEGSESNRVFVLTARHVLPPNAHCNDLYARENNRQPRREVILLGIKAYQSVLESIMSKIGGQSYRIDYYQREIEGLGEAAKQAKAWEGFKKLLNEAEELIETLNEFHSKITKFWSVENRRILGHIAYAPSICISTDKCYTEDRALVELHREKIDWKGFKGNVLDLGTFRSILLRSSSLTIISRNLFVC